MTTEVQLKDNDTIIIGGLIQNEITKVVAKIPFLGDLPVLGDLFRSKKFQEDQTELLVFLTPVILKGNENQPAFMLEGVGPDERETMLKEKGG
jgi:type II secretory pathway component GspD/PulD (secretin)